jgi:hypothetical protein
MQRWAQVAEWLMAADCKSAVLWDYEGSNPSLCTTRKDVRGMPSGRSVEQKFWTALALYGILAGVIWFTMGEGHTFLFGREIEIRWIPMFVIGTFVFRTVMARAANRIRQDDMRRDDIRRDGGDGQV